MGWELDKLAFFTDHIFKVDPNGLRYSEGKITSSTFDRYLSICDQVVVVCRESAISHSTAQLYSLSSNSHVEFRALRGSSWLSIFIRHGLHNFGLVRSVIKSSSFVALRCPAFISALFLPSVLLERKEYAVEVVGDAFQAIRSATRGKAFSLPLAIMMHIITKVVIKNATGAIYVTASILQRNYPCSGITASASNVEIDSVSCEVLQRRLAKSSRGLPEKFVVGVIGSFNNKYKGIDVLVKAVGELRRKGLPVRLEVVGSGDAGNLNISDDLRDHIILRGSLSRDEIFEWLEQIDVYCQPSRTEGLPRALIEAMSRGCPAVATDVGGIPELLENNYLCGPGDVDGLALLLRRVYESGEERDAMALRNFKFSQAYNKDVLSARRRDFWAAIANR